MMQQTEGAGRDGQASADGGPSHGKMNTRQIEQHLKSAVDGLVPDVLGRIDLTVPREVAAPPRRKRRLGVGMYRAAALAAACLCLVALGGGMGFYQNRQVESVIGIDVNPSVELSINRRNRVLQAEPLNEDAVAILEGLDLKGVELNTAVNAVIGSMVSQGYLDDLDNAILVTVSNDSISKASELRSTVVGDIQRTLQDNEVQAVVYDQQVMEDAEVQALADEYGISYGKAYFLSEVVRATPELSDEDMGRLSHMSIEQIAGEITDGAMVGGSMPKLPESIAITMTSETTTAGTVEAPTEETSPQESPTEESTVMATADTTAPSTTASSSAEPESESAGREIEIDYIDVEGRTVNVYFASKVRWKNPTISVRDSNGQKYAAMITDTGSKSCEIEVSGVPGGSECSFAINGIYLGTGGPPRSVSGSFTMPVVSDSATEENGESVTTEEDDEEDEEPTTAESQEATPPSSSESEPATTEGAAKETTQEATEATEGTTEGTAAATEAPQTESTQTEAPAG